MIGMILKDALRFIMVVSNMFQDVLVSYCFSPGIIPIIPIIRLIIPLALQAWYCWGTSGIIPSIIRGPVGTSGGQLGPSQGKSVETVPVEEGGAQTHMRKLHRALWSHAITVTASVWKIF